MIKKELDGGPRQRTGDKKTESRTPQTRTNTMHRLRRRTAATYQMDQRMGGLEKRQEQTRKETDRRKGRQASTETFRHASPGHFIYGYQRTSTRHMRGHYRKRVWEADWPRSNIEAGRERGGEEEREERGRREGGEREEERKTSKTTLGRLWPCGTEEWPRWAGQTGREEKNEGGQEGEVRKPRGAREKTTTCGQHDSTTAHHTSLQSRPIAATAAYMSGGEAPNDNGEEEQPST